MTTWTAQAGASSAYANPRASEWDDGLTLWDVSASDNAPGSLWDVADPTTWAATSTASTSWAAA